MKTKAVTNAGDSTADKIKLALSTSFYLGLAPVAPGTFGTLGGVVLAVLLGATGGYFFLALILALTVLYVGGRWLGDWAEQRAAGKDPQFFVVDEVLGYLIAIAWFAPPSALTLVVGFALFRLFDVTKPPPAKRLERLGGGDGIMLDDAIAGVYAFLCLALLRAVVLDPSAWVR